MSYLAAGGMALSAAGGIAGGLMGGSGARKQVAEMRRAIEYQKQKDAENKANLSPYMDFGKGQLQGINDTLAQDPKSFLDPGYQFRQEQGLKGLLGNAATAGMLGSGDTLRAATQFNQDMASQEYGNAFNRRLQEGGFRQGLAGMGLQAASTLGGLGNQGAANVGNLTTNTDFGASDRMMGQTVSGLGGMLGGGLSSFGGANAFAKK
jgi:hypothetical protein